MDKSEKLPNWILKILPVLTEHMSLSDFEKWIYLSESEKFFIDEIYIELISFDYGKRLSDFITVLCEFLSFEERETLYRIVDFIKHYRDFSNIDWDVFKFLPISNLLLEYVYEHIDNLVQYLCWGERLEQYEYSVSYDNLLSQYLAKMIFLFHCYEQFSDLRIICELNKIYRLEM